MRALVVMLPNSDPRSARHTHYTHVAPVGSTGRKEVLMDPCVETIRDDSGRMMTVYKFVTR